MFYYSSVGLLALMLHFIINREDIMQRIGREERKEPGKLVVFRYKLFLNIASCFFLIDMIGGILYGFHHIPVLFPFIYSATIFYFLFMFLSMLTWVCFVVAYLNKRRPRSRALLYAVWSMFILGIVYLMINRFHPMIFSFNEAHEFVPEKGRYIAYILQIAVYAVTTVYMLWVALKSKGIEKYRYFAVGLTCFVLGAFQILQIFNAMYPFYSMGLIIATAVVHSFVEAGEKKEKEIYDNIANSLAEDYEAMYYINIETGEYREFSASQRYKSMNVPFAGKDFYKETQSEQVNSETQTSEDKEAAKLAKALALFNIMVNTAEAIAKMTSRESGKGIIGIATTAAGIASIMANMASAISILTQAKFAKGAVNIGGAGSETSDSIPARISRGESVMNAKATKMFEPILIAMNNIGNGVALPRNNYVQTQQTADMTEAFTMAAEKIRPVVDVREVTRVQNRVETLETLDSL